MNKKHFTFTERVKLEYRLNLNIDCSAIKLAKDLDKSRNAIYYELKTYTNVYSSKTKKIYGHDDYICETLKHFPFCCNGCAKTNCSHRCKEYRAYEADKKANDLLVSSRVDTKRRKDAIKILNNSVCPLINNGASIEVAKNNVNNCDLSASTIRRYIEKGLVNSKRHNLPRAIRFRVKKEYKYTVPALSANILNGRTYEDYKKYMEAYPKSKVVQLDSVIGKANDKKAILTIFFLNSKLQIGKLYNRKHQNTVDTMKNIYKTGIDNGIKLFDVIVADNGSEFKDLYKLEKDDDNNQICKVFYCDPYRSCQKAECEKNHVFFRRIVPKGKSFANFLQEDIDTIFSHINSYPRASLKNKSPYDLFALEYKPIILFLLNIVFVAIKDIKLKDYKGWLK